MDNFVCTLKISGRLCLCASRAIVRAWRRGRLLTAGLAPRHRRSDTRIKLRCTVHRNNRPLAPTSSSIQMPDDSHGFQCVVIIQHDRDARPRPGRIGRRAGATVRPLHGSRLSSMRATHLCPCEAQSPRRHGAGPHCGQQRQSPRNLAKIAIFLMSVLVSLVNISISRR